MFTTTTQKNHIFLGFMTILLALIAIIFPSLHLAQAQPIHLEREQDQEILYLEEEELLDLISGDSIEVMVAGETEQESLLASGALSLVAGAAVLPKASSKVLSLIRSLGGSKGKKMTLIMSVASAAAVSSLLKMQQDEDLLARTEEKSLFPAENLGKEPTPKGVFPPLELQDQEEESLENLKNATSKQKQRLKARLLKALKEQKIISEVYDLRLESYASEQNIQVHEIPNQERLGIIQEILFQHMDQLSLPSQELFSVFLDLSAEKNFAEKEKIAMITSSYARQDIKYSQATNATVLTAVILCGASLLALPIVGPIAAIGLGSGSVLGTISLCMIGLEDTKNENIKKELRIKRKHINK